MTQRNHPKEYLAVRLNRLALSVIPLILSSSLMACSDDHDPDGTGATGGRVGSRSRGGSGGSGGVDSSGGSHVEAGGRAADCVPPAPCGGDIVGDWSFESVCATSSQAHVEGCPEASSDYSGMLVSGAVAFDVNGTYSVSYDTAGELIVSVPRACLPDELTCGALSDDGSTCTADGSNCRCRISLVNHVENVGNWETSGDLLKLDGEEQSPFCAAEDSLELHLEADGAALTFELSRKETGAGQKIGAPQ